MDMFSPVQATRLSSATGMMSSRHYDGQDASPTPNPTASSSTSTSHQQTSASAKRMMLNSTSATINNHNVPKGYDSKSLASDATTKPPTMRSSRSAEVLHHQQEGNAGNARGPHAAIGRAVTFAHTGLAETAVAPSSASSRSTSHQQNQNHDRSYHGGLVGRGNNSNSSLPKDSANANANSRSVAPTKANLQHNSQFLVLFRQPLYLLQKRLHLSILLQEFFHSNLKIREFTLVSRTYTKQ